MWSFDEFSKNASFLKLNKKQKQTRKQSKNQKENRPANKQMRNHNGTQNQKKNNTKRLERIGNTWWRVDSKYMRYALIHKHTNTQ